MEALRGHFRPEFLNRIDEIVIFDRLSDREIVKIVDIQLDRFTRRLGKQKLPSGTQRQGEAPIWPRKDMILPMVPARSSESSSRKSSIPLSMEILDGKSMRVRPSGRIFPGVN